MAEPISCNLVSNALAYLLLAGEQSQEGSARMTKHALATLADGVELLLKARLEIYDWSLLFKNVDDAERAKITTGEFQSVTFDQAVKRLKQICGVEIDKKPLGMLNTLRSLRNKIRHFAVRVEGKTAESLIAKTYSFAIDFTTANLEAHLDAEGEEELTNLRRLLGAFEGFVEARQEEIKETLEAQDYSVHTECPRCLQETLYATDGESSCAFCGYRASGEEVAGEWFDRQYGHIGDPKERMMLDDEIDSCPECGSRACVHDDTHGRICFSCGESGDYTRCAYCDQLFSGELHPGGRCDECWHHLMSKD